MESPKEEDPPSPDKHDSLLEDQSFEIDRLVMHRELTIVPEEAKAMNSTSNLIENNDFYRIESLQEGQYSKILEEFQ